MGVSTGNHNDKMTKTAYTPCSNNTEQVIQYCKWLPGMMPPKSALLKAKGETKKTLYLSIWTLKLY